MSFKGFSAKDREYLDWFAEKYGAHSKNVPTKDVLEWCRIFNIDVAYRYWQLCKEHEIFIEKEQVLKDLTGALGDGVFKEYPKLEAEIRDIENSPRYKNFKTYQEVEDVMKFKHPRWYEMRALLRDEREI